ncbi:ATP-binding protein [Cupriavidus sp. WKF15]|uniref:sensor histidine kinase n=1 Tax=Cupriavidus sp. WKF15 TaxID=3032282 RepID=UPI0023E3439E|nr:ATP-binding protein [Cupriavidus sp. WKF15]WER50542.1 ATP-binding protein [Cupriavidus sp. WKF15]
MLQTLYGRLAVVLMAVFIAIGALMILASQKMIETQRLIELATDLIIGTVAFSLVAALIVFRLLTVRLRVLSEAIETFRAGDFSTPVRLVQDGRADDEIQKLSTAFEEMSERIVTQFAQLSQVDQQRRELLANVSHDLRTPLASMQGYLEMLLLKAEELTPDDRNRYLQVATRHCERLGKLVQDLFDLTKLEAREVQPRLESFPLSELAQDVVQKFTLAANKRGLALLATSGPGCPPVSADIGMIERVLENLIENAMRYTPAGGEISVDVQTAGERVELTVRDTGQGIDASRVQGVFDRYYRVERTESDNGSNVGLGLAISRRIVQLHGGEIRVRSALGKGTAFTIDLARG